MALTRFIPELYYTEEMFNPPSNSVENGLQISSVSTMTLRNLESLNNAEMRKDFLDDLITRRRQGKKNVLFIGSFYGNEDLHKTVFKPTHGPVIIFNIFYNLHKGKHQVTSILFYLLFIGFSILSYMMIRPSNKKFYKNVRVEIREQILNEKKLKLKVRPPIALCRLYIRFTNWLNKWTAPKLEKHQILSLKSFLLALIDLLIDDFYIILVFLFVFIINFITGVLINIFELILYFIVFKTIFNSFLKPYTNQNE
ncbi:hypothetical protein EON73_00275 [bacterium]|nr:MAG: hypothetical protein EON73_00275 [bacterium]